MFLRNVHGQLCTHGSAMGTGANSDLIRKSTWLMLFGKSGLCSDLGRRCGERLSTTRPCWGAGLVPGAGFRAWGQVAYCSLRVYGYLHVPRYRCRVFHWRFSMSHACNTGVHSWRTGHSSLSGSIIYFSIVEHPQSNRYIDQYIGPPNLFLSFVGGKIRTCDYYHWEHVKK